MADWDPLANEIFLRAIEAGSASEHAAVLDRSCGDDVELRRKVEALLMVHDGAGSFLEHPAPGLVSARSVTSGEGATLPTLEPGRSSVGIDENTEPFVPSSFSSDNPVSRPVTEGAGTRIGAYKLLQRIGEGGMGIVYMAEQEAPVRRKVALKIIKPGMDTGQVVARFEAERQALALMDHPNIAKVFDAGATGTGRPFFVMELVHGVPFTEYCDELSSRPRERLELFVPVCRAIQHAHQKGIIHRDVKPSNVMVTLVDGRPTPKVIDFGVAKATGQALTERSLFTQFGAIVGTFEYMSPEQAEQSAHDVDTRSDVFSLGVLLYELLTGSTPLERARLREAGYAEILRRIREEEPPRPSTRLSDSGTALASIAAQRHTEPAKLTRLVRGELDWIVMKALEKDRTRRYESASGFAQDIERYLADEGVEACPPSRRYRLRKFARKNRAALATAAAFAVLLLVSTAVSGYLALRARSAERLAKLRLADSEEARTESERLRDQSKAVSDFMVDAFRKPDPNQDGRDLKVVDLLNAAGDRLDAQFAGTPATRAALLVALGHTYIGLGLPERAVDLSARALDALRGSPAPDNRQMLECRSLLATAYIWAGRAADAIALQEETFRLATARFGIGDPLTIQSRYSLGEIYSYAGRTAEAISLNEETLKLAVSRLGPDHPLTNLARNALAEFYRRAGRPAEAIAILEKALKGVKLEAEPANLGAQNNLALAYFQSGRIVEAITLIEDNLKLRTSRYGPAHPETLRGRYNLGIMYRQAGRTAEAVAMAEESLKLSTASSGPDHLDTINWRHLLAQSYFDFGRQSDAIVKYEELLKQADVVFGANHPKTLSFRDELAGAYLQAGRMAQAVALDEGTLKFALTHSGPNPYDMGRIRERLKKASNLGGGPVNEVATLEEELKLVTAKLGPDHHDTLWVRSNLSYAYLRAGRTAEAVMIAEATLKLAEVKLGPDHSDTLSLRASLGNTYLDVGRTAEAVTMAEGTLKIAEAKFGPDHFHSMRARSNLAGAYRKAGRVAESISIYEQSLKRITAGLGPGSIVAFFIRNGLAASYRDAGRVDEAIGVMHGVVPGLANALGAAHPDTLRAANRLAALYEEVGRWADAEALRRESLASRRKATTPDSPELAAELASLGLDLAAQEKLAEAEPFVRESLKIFEAKQPDDWATFHARNLLGACLLARRQFAEAEPLIVRGYEGMKARESKIPPAEKLRLQEAAARVVRFYEAWSKPEEAARWRKTLDPAPPKPR